MYLSNSSQRIWVSNIIGTDYKRWKNEFVILDCGTGCGKSYFCLHILGSYAKSQKKKILYLCNRSKLRKQVYEEAKRLKLLDVILVTSYQKLQRDIQDGKTIPYFDYIVADECHYFTTDATFNDYTDVSYNYVMKQKDSVVLLISATAKAFFSNLLEKKKVKEKNHYKLDKDYSYVDKLYYYQSDELVSIINEILENEPDSKIVVFCNVGSRIIEMNKVYKDTAHYYCAKSSKDKVLKKVCGWLDDEDDKRTKKTNDCIKRYSDELITFEKRILFTTSVLDNGVDLKDERIKHIFTEIIDVDIMIQSLGRKRSMNENDTCTFYIREYQKSGIQGFINNTNKQLEPVKLYKEDYQEFYKKYGNGKNRGKIQKNDIFYSLFKEKKSVGQIRVNECKYRKYVQSYNIFSTMKEIGHIAFLEWILPTELRDKGEQMIINVKQIDLFMDFLKSIEGKMLFANDREYIKEEFKTTVAIKLSGKSIGIGTLNGQLDDLYKNIYPCRFYNEDVDGKRYIDKRRILKDGTVNPNRDKTYWILEDRTTVKSLG